MSQEFDNTAATALAQALHYHNSLFGSAPAASVTRPTDDQVIVTAQKFVAFLAGKAAAPASASPKQPASSIAPTTPKTVTPSTTDADAPTYQAVADVVGGFVKANGRAPAVILLEPLKVTTITSFKEKPAELKQILAIFTDPVKVAAAIARAASEAAAAKAAAEAKA